MRGNISVVRGIDSRQSTKTKTMTIHPTVVVVILRLQIVWPVKLLE